MPAPPGRRRRDGRASGSGLHSTLGNEKRGCGFGGLWQGDHSDHSTGFGDPSTDPHALLIPSFPAASKGDTGVLGDPPVGSSGGHRLFVTPCCPHRIPTGTRRRTRWAGRASFPLTTSRSGKGSKLASSSASCREYPRWLGLQCPLSQQKGHSSQGTARSEGSGGSSVDLGLGVATGESSECFGSWEGE